MATNYLSYKIDGTKLVAVMVKKKMNAKQLAEVSGVSRQTISSMRSGNRCAVDALIKIAEALGVEPKELLDD